MHSKTALFAVYTMLVSITSLYCMWMRNWKWYVYLFCINLVIQLLRLRHSRQTHARSTRTHANLHLANLEADLAHLQAVHDAANARLEQGYLQSKIAMITAVRNLNLQRGLHLTTRNPGVYTERQKEIIHEWTTGPDAQMRYELLAPADHKSVSAAVLIQRHIRLHQRHMRAVKTCQRRIRQLLWIRYELCNPEADMNAQYMHLLELESNTFDKKWSRLTNFWNRAWK